MSGIHGRTIPVLLAALVLVGGANIAAYAANGKPFLLGGSNSETKPAALKNTGSGPALSLTSRSSSASLAVSSSKVVKHLNAAMVDGLNSSQLKARDYRYVLPNVGPFSTFTDVSFPGLPKGLYLMNYSITVIHGNTASCWFHGATAHPAFAFSAMPGATTDGASGSAVLDSRGSKGPITMTCNGTSFSFYSTATDIESVVNFVSLGSVTDKSAGTSPTP
ncbi:MAG: hypothetical protein WAV00_15035 [Nocardioides sp.]